MEESHVDHVANEGAADETVQESTSEPATISVSEPARVLQSSPERTVLADHGQPNQLFEQLQGPVLIFCCNGKIGARTSSLENLTPPLSIMRLNL